MVSADAIAAAGGEIVTRSSVDAEQRKIIVAGESSLRTHPEAMEYRGVTILAIMGGFSILCIVGFSRVISARSAR
jgi:hypothetical protein